MNIRLLSDCHTETDSDGGASFAKSQDPTDIDVLVLDGDIVTRQNEVPLEIFANNFKNVVYILGNHDHWYGIPEKTIDWGRSLSAKWSNFHFLENDIAVIDGQRFLGTTLWVPEKPQSKLYEPLMNDFALIHKARQFIYSQNTKSIEFLNNNVQDGDVVATHHLPSYECVAPEWESDKLNIFFANDDLDHIWYQKKSINLFGHTHTSMKGKKIGSAVMHCNPRGYNVRNGLNKDFDPKYTIKI